MTQKRIRHNADHPTFLAEKFDAEYPTCDVWTAWWELLDPDVELANLRYESAEDAAQRESIAWARHRRIQGTIRALRAHGLDRHETLAALRQMGYTLEAISGPAGVTRERVRQLVLAGVHHCHCATCDATRKGSW